MLPSISEDIELGHQAKYRRSSKSSSSNQSSNLSVLERSKLAKIIISLCIGIPAIIIIVTLDILHATDTRLPWQLWSALASCGMAQLSAQNKTLTL
jgi:hypothetical protein